MDKKTKRKIIVLLAIILLIEITIIAKETVSNKGSFLGSVISGMLVKYTNNEREAIGINKLKNSELLQKAAELKAEDMVKNGYFEHYSPDGKSPWYWLDQAGYKYEKAGENLAVNFSDSKDVVDAWMNSPSHKKNILKDSYEEIGIATKEGKFKGNDAVFVVQFFGTPVTNLDTDNFVLNETIQKNFSETDKIIKGAEIEKIPETSKRNYLLLIAGTFLTFLTLVFILIFSKT